MIHIRRHSAFTLIELLISIAIVGILSVIMFTNFSQEKNRNALKGAVSQLQTDIQSSQTKAQGGVLYNNQSQAGYRVSLATSNGYHDLVAHATVANGGGTTQILRRTYQGSGSVVVQKISGLVSGLTTTFTTMNIEFSSPNGTATLSGNAGTASLATIVLKSAKLNVCYAITVTAGVGTVSKRQLAQSECS